MDVDELVTALKAIPGVRASDEEAGLNLPAVWVRPTGLRRDTLSGAWTEIVSVRLLTNDEKPTRARKALRDLLDKLTAAGVDPDSDPAFATVIRPSNNSAVPALVFQLDLLP